MGLTYLHHTPWERISREERFFCARLFELARPAPEDFAKWLASRADIDLPKTGEWELGFEVALYRDLLWHRHRSAAGEGFSRKRTFDLCLFHESCVVVIEAKVTEAFEQVQATTFENDRAQIPRLLGDDVDVVLVGLASSRYFENARKHGKRGLLDVFDGLITWKDVAQLYPDTVLQNAELLYKSAPLHPVPLQTAELEGAPLYAERG